MTYEVLITPTENGFAAAVLGLPALIAEAATRDEALAKAQAEAEELLNKSELVRVEVKGKAARKSFAGMWANDKTFNAFIAAMKAYRAELNADPDQL
jgi:predicted RNase H-like HicB family nuclease